MNVLKALSITRDSSSDYDSFVEAVMVLYANLFNGKVVYYCHETGQTVYFSLTECEKDYLRWELLSKGKNPSEDGLLESFEH